MKSVHPKMTLNPLIHSEKLRTKRYEKVR